MTAQTNIQVRVSSPTPIPTRSTDIPKRGTPRGSAGASSRLARADHSHPLGGVDVAHFANITRESPPSTLGGVAKYAGMRVLLCGQTSPQQNGIYVVPASPATDLVRDTQFETATAIDGWYGEVRKGTYAGALLGTSMSPTGTVESDAITVTTLRWGARAPFGPLANANGATKGNYSTSYRAGVAAIAEGNDSVSVELTGATSGNYIVHVTQIGIGATPTIAAHSVTLLSNIFQIALGADAAEDTYFSWIAIEGTA